MHQQERVQAYVYTLHSENDVTRFITENRFVVCKLSAKWCMPCKATEPFYFQLANEYQDNPVEFTIIDIDEIPEIGRLAYGIPAYIFYMDGELMQNEIHIGADLQPIRTTINNNLTKLHRTTGL